MGVPSLQLALREDRRLPALEATDDPRIQTGLGLGNFLIGKYLGDKRGGADPDESAPVHARFGFDDRPSKRPH
jgi:hypothetical protein